MPDGDPLLPEDPAELGAYRLAGRLGEGSQGVVYLGRDSSGTRVAIKLLHARMAADPGSRDRFMRELSAAKKVARFCTAQVLDADLAGDHPYIVSEYVEGRPLRSHILADGPRTGGTLERLAIGTLTALAAIHRAGIVHRDFTPHNVLLGPDGPRVIDFGIARALNVACEEETNSIGTPAYMAPEQVTAGKVGPPADMFAWGATILFAGTGRPPFGNESVAAVMERVMHSDPDVTALPEPLRSVVSSCLAKDPAVRPTAQQAQASLLGHDASVALMPPPAFGSTTGESTGESRAAPEPAEAIPAFPLPGRSVPGAALPPVAASTPDPAAQNPTVHLMLPGSSEPGTSGRNGSPLSPATSRTAPVADRYGKQGRRWMVLTGAGVVVAGVALAIPLWPGGGDTVTTPKAKPASVSETPKPSTPARQRQARGVMEAAPPKKHKKPPPGCREYSRSYPVAKVGTVLVKALVCKGGFTGTTVTADSVPKDAYTPCVQLRGHVTGPDGIYISTGVMTSKGGRPVAFENGPKFRWGSKSKRTEDFVAVNTGRCKGSSPSWQSKTRLATG